MLAWQQGFLQVVDSHQPCMCLQRLGSMVLCGPYKPYLKRCRTWLRHFSELRCTQCIFDHTQCMFPPLMKGYFPFQSPFRSWSNCCQYS